eukprot:CAMPEP_0117657936 /NCGR_PEP_ID=MMETSP0804-20121206/5595_1 /TAXON_ID=1074897 /ORGANISM="Tetraselmis astigmatica, Strain CCMP880" /LENGTH=364 /DNA_ID=CAMNT_0005464421 /DNA_START=241 /DNA_END=1331 /DNA_ORIENTATION=+
MATERYAFVTEWTDPNTEVTWQYQLFYYYNTGEVEMFDIKNRRTFLKKTKYNDLHPDSLYVGGLITVFSRQLKILEFGDDYTKRSLTSKTQKTLAMIKPDAYQHLGKIIDAITRAGFRINKMKMSHLSHGEACAFYAVHEGRPFYDKLTSFMSSGRIVAMELMAPDAIAKWRALIGPTNSDTARAEAPKSLRALFGTDNTMNACHGSDAPETAAEESAFFFGQRVGPCHYANGTTLGIVKPSAVEGGHTGAILDAVLERFHITAMQMFSVDRANTAEFLEVYKGVVHPGEFTAMVDELAKGPLVAFEVADPDGADPCEPFRELCGPADPEIARVLRPASLRARFGDAKVTNALHCTDLSEDGPL